MTCINVYKYLMRAPKVLSQYRCWGSQSVTFRYFLMKDTSLLVLCASNPCLRVRKKLCVPAVFSAEIYELTGFPGTVCCWSQARIKPLFQATRPSWTSPLPTPKTCCGSPMSTSASSCPSVRHCSTTRPHSHLRSVAEAHAVHTHT